MIDLTVDGCNVSILPIVNGIASEADKVRDAFGNYEAYGATLGIEGVQAIKSRITLEDEFEVSELDLAYAHRMEDLTGTPVEMPSPAMCVLIDLCSESDMNVIPLDMNDADFTELYCETVKTWDFVKEHRLAKKGMKKRFSSTTPEDFALEWDGYVNGVKGYRNVSLKREQHIASQIREVAKYRRSLLVVAEIERAEGIAALLRC